MAEECKRNLHKEKNVTMDGRRLSTMTESLCASWFGLIAGQRMAVVL